MTSQQLDTTHTINQQVTTFRHTLVQMKNEIAAALPAHMTGDRFLRLILTEVRKNPELAECSTESIFGGILTAAALGLEPGLNGECWLIPRKVGKGPGSRKEATFQVGYKGIIKLFWQNPLASYLDTGVVYANDAWKFRKGLDPILEHTPATGDRGAVRGYYAVVGLTTGARIFDFFTPKQISALRGTAGPNGGISDPEHWMERKTALLQVMKMAPKSTDLASAASVDGTVQTVEAAAQVAAASTGPVNPTTGEVLEAEPVEGGAA
ncbi:RecT-like DNA pairing protein [Propionibacterium phage B3]|uniref:RecT-like DNA pairing protein n=1 Tax=Propionibacterium phage B3 TaxID=1897533 RepID=A0A1D8ETL3_9CAUD|nr:RecT-like ssDNA annealing protein [Propionibacterium phage B3]AOT24330.1 RecT-like DNA pairing protein [Propionibacterium phage B3]